VRIDLHTHSTASDGTDTPEQLVAAAHRAGLDVLAITDHDTTVGWTAAIAALPTGLTLVPGAELSCGYYPPEGGRIALHLLAYLFDPAAEPLRAQRARLRDSRLRRGRAIVANLVSDGVPISWSQVDALAAGGAVGRPHIARALVANGVVTDVSAAFRTLLSPTAKYYVRKAAVEVFTAIALVRAAGGVSVFAHPFARRRGPVVDQTVIAAMAAAGLDGLEVDHPDHSVDDRARLSGLASDLGLLVTGSSDYHGSNKSTPLGACQTDPIQFEALRAKSNARQPVTG
jgi:predicted metal-dependent phosphoesterase TrpH